MVVEIDWSTGLYGPAVKVDLTPQGASQPLDKIVALKIDNSGNGDGLFIQFPDSSDVITVQPDTVMTRSVLTNQMTFIVYLASGFVSSYVVRIHAMNVYIDPSQDILEFDVVNQEQGSFNNFHARALGDLTLSFVLDLTNTAPVTILSHPPFSGNTLIITDIVARLYACYNQTAVEAFIRLNDNQLGPGGPIVRQWDFGVGPDLALWGATVLEQSNGMQARNANGVAITFDPSHGLVLKNQVALSAGKLSLVFGCTGHDNF